MVPQVSGYNIINRFQSLLGYMKDDKKTFPNGAVGPADQKNVLMWVTWLKANWARSGSYNIYGWLQHKGWFYSPIGAFFQQMAGTTGSVITKHAEWLSTQNGDAPSNSTVIIGDVIQLTPTNLRKLFDTTVDAMNWWNKRVAAYQLGGQYLDTIVENMAPVNAAAYRVPTFYNPSDVEDESGIWWKFMKDTGYNAITTKALSLSISASQLASAKAQSEAQRWGSAAKVLGWINMSEPAKQLQDKVNEFYKKYTEAQSDIAVSKELLEKNPSLKGKYGTSVSKYANKISDIGINAYSKVKPFNIWPGTPPQSLGGVTVGIMAAKAGIALAALGIITLYINSLVDTMSGANTLKNEIIKDANDDAKKSLATLDEAAQIVQKAQSTGQMTPAQANEELLKIEKQRAAIRTQMQAAAKESSKGFLQQATVAGMVGIGALIAWKAM